MKTKHIFAHCLIFFVEVSVLSGLLLVLAALKIGHGSVVHNFAGQTTLCLAMGIGLVIAPILVRIVMGSGENGHMIRLSQCTGILVGCIAIVGGAKLATQAYPDVFRFSRMADAEERWDRLGAVTVDFDPAGGVMDETWRIVKAGAEYGMVMNVFPSEDERRMQLHDAKVDLLNGWIVVDSSAEGIEQQFVNFFVSNAIPNQVLGDKWTYVVDVEELSGKFTYWPVGQTCQTNWNVYTQLGYATVRSTIRAGEKQFLILSNEKWGERCNMLDRAYIHLSSGQHLKAKFRVALFGGTGINESHYHYVKPGETLSCPLPIPTRKGYAFDGWYDGERRIVENAKVEKKEAHTLKARWRKL